MRTHSLLLTGLGLLLAVTFRAHAATPPTTCSKQAVSSVLSQAYPQQKSAWHIDHQRLACLADARHLWLAVPLITPDGSTDSIRHGDLELLVADPATHAITARLRLHGWMNEDAIAVTRIRLDHTPDPLADGTTSLALRITRANHSRANPFESTALYLYVMRNGRLHVVLDGAVIDTRNGEIDDMCKAHFDRIRRTPSVAAEQHHGLHDLRFMLGATIRDITPGKQDHCMERAHKGPVQPRQVRFDGHRYRVPDTWKPLR